MIEKNKKIVESHEGVPAQVFNEFLNRLKEKEIPDEVVEALRKTIFEDRNLSEAAIKYALFPGEQTK